jgi:hypothetical protein
MNRELATKFAEALNEKVNQDKKCDVWVCSLSKPGLPGFKEAKCKYCKVKIYYSPDMKIHIAKKHKKICNLCAFKKHGGEMDPLQKEIISQFN